MSPVLSGPRGRDHLSFYGLQVSPGSPDVASIFWSLGKGPSFSRWSPGVARSWCRQGHLVSLASGDMVPLGGSTMVWLWRQVSTLGGSSGDSCWGTCVQW